MAVEAIVKPIVEQLSSIIAREVEQEVRLVVGVRKEIKKLTSNFEAIKAVLFDAEQRQVKEIAVKVWLDNLKDASYDVEDVLDEWNTAILKLQIEGAEKSLVTEKKVCFNFPSPIVCFKQVGLRRDIAVKIREINEKLDSIAERKDKLNLDKTRSIEEPARYKTCCFFDKSEICGRDKEQNDIIRKLLSDNNEKEKSLHVISIVGMGGIGKTTLAQLACNNEEVKKHFHKTIWVCVSDPFNEIQIVKAIIEGLTNDGHALVELQAHLNHIRESIVGNRFLLVLDDVWVEDYSWGPLYDCLNNGLHGSKILITTRKETVAQSMKSTDMIKVGELIEEDSWLLFKQLAFSNRSEQECNKLEKIGRDIVGKCKGLPLAVKIVGSLLSLRKTEQQWQRILDSDFWNLEELEKGLFPPLLLSYNDLPSKEKRCFSYCAIFPKDYVMDKNELIRLWMAQGFLGLEQSEDMETIGQDCFDNLAMHSFFQEFDKDESDNIIWCKMHDIVHDFAQFLVKNECFTMEINSSEVQSLPTSYEKAHHLMLIFKNDKASVPLNICDAQKLRSLSIEVKAFIYFSMENERLLSNRIEKLTCLRALHLNGIIVTGWDKMIPREVGKLIHLRYLKICTNLVKELPETLCDLYNLQTLYLLECHSLEKLPQGMGKLVNLRHLITPNCDRLSYMPKGMGNLRCLRTLTELVIGGDVGAAEGCSIGCLQNLNHLGGFLRLTGLGNVRDSTDAKRAQLNNKRNLTYLYMSFNDTREASSSASVVENDGAVLEALQPPLNLKILFISDYRGTRFPEWMISLTQLKSVGFRRCKECKLLPPLGELPSLESLWISTMDGIKRVGNEFLGIENATTPSSSSSSFIAFPKLKKLKISFTEEWEDWDDENTRQITIMPSLSKLSILYCPKLKALPEYILHLTSLKKCSIVGCTKLEFPERMISWTQLKSLKFSCSNDSEHLPPFGKLPSLEFLQISRMDGIKRVGNEFLGIENAATPSSSSSSFIAFPKLKNLEIEVMGGWEDWDDENTRQITIMPSLSELAIRGCLNLKALPEYILHLTSLKTCTIFGCPKLEKLPVIQE